MKKLKREIVKHAKECYPNECCGVAISTCDGYIYHRIDNISADPVNNFEMNMNQYHEAEKLGDVAFIVHSHTDANSFPSEMDEVFCDVSGINWLICAYPNIEFTEISPRDNNELVGRRYLLGVQDCYTIIQDFYKQEFNITLDNFSVPYEWWETGENRYIDNFEKAGFDVIEWDDRKRGDVAIMALGSSIANHGAVFVERDKILHHQHSRISTITGYSEFYQERTIHIVRYRGLNA